jgi:endonuclease/exonuclease/phosphatase (EEP) superfamily protein YafD
VVTFNIWGRNFDADATTEFLLRTDADVVLMQEVFGSSKVVAERLRAKYPHGVVCSENRCSLAVLSKHPVRAQGMQRQRWHGPAAKALSAAWAEIDAPGGRFTALTTHYTWPTWVHAQEWQRAELVRLTRGFPRDDLIVTGDFNLTPWSKALREQDARLGLRRRTRGVFSWPVVASRYRVRPPVPLLPIDHVYAGEAWRTVSVERGPALGSDHYPVIVTLRRAH